MKATGRNIVEVYLAANQIEAQFIQRLLAEHQIIARIDANGHFGELGHWAFGWADGWLNHLPRIWVDKENLEAAHKIILLWEQARNKQREVDSVDWICEQCAADVPFEFELCWQCESAKVAA